MSLSVDTPIHNIHSHRDISANAFRRRSTQIQHSIALELDHSFTSEHLSSFDETPESTVMVPPVKWRIFVITTSITNYSCCGIRITGLVSRSRSMNIPNPMGWVANKLGGEEIGAIKIKLCFSLLDWCLDFGTAAYHYFNEAWIPATLTLLIVLTSGVTTSIGFLRDSEIRLSTRQKAKEIGTVWQILLFVPTFFPFVSGRLWLEAAIGHKNSADFLESNEIQLQKEKDKERVKDWSLKAFWLETVLEAKPQALLQTLFLLESNTRFTSPLDFLPIILSLWSMHSVTSTIYELVASNFEDKTGIYSKLYGNTYTAISIMAPVMLINVVRDNLDTDWGKFLSTLIALVLYYSIFELIYELTYFGTQKYANNSVEGCEHLKVKENNKHRRFSKVYQGIITIFYLGCCMIWSFHSQAGNNQLKRTIVIILFSILLVGNVVSFIKAFDFVVESFRLKNVKIDEVWEKIQEFIKNRKHQEQDTFGTMVQTNGTMIQDEWSAN